MFSGSYADADYLWSPVFPASLSMPCARNRHSVCVWGGGVFVYGGRGTRGTLKDFWRYDIGRSDACLVLYDVKTTCNDGGMLSIN